MEVMVQTAEGSKPAETNGIAPPKSLSKVKRVDRGDLESSWGEGVKSRLQLMDAAFGDRVWRSKLIGATGDNKHLFLRMGEAVLLAVIDRDLMSEKTIVRCQFLLGPSEGMYELLKMAINWAGSLKADFEFPKAAYSELPMTEIRKHFKTREIRVMALE